MFRYCVALSIILAVFTVSLSVLAQSSTAQSEVDENYLVLEAAVGTAGLTEVASIDHARLAQAEGVEMPASRVLIFSDPEINSSILAGNVRAGLDLPFRALSFDQDDLAQITYTGSQFLVERHGLTETSMLEAFDNRMLDVLGGLVAKPAPTDGLTLDYGVIELKSKLNVSEAVGRLTEVVMAQDDTVWFGEIDFAAEASQLGMEIPEAVLLLFGGPAPGGVAMADFPAIGLDAFCQKLLVYADDDGGSTIIYNDIAALAELYYGTSTKPHRALNERLTATFRSAIE
ncbi:DUF302 domain-containing protein [Ruegeria sp. AD91A]|uniref:DUF302 domain-containing protein n=1 Tax=Ruegeria sp. AD91A TaxID=2293862 RepID=UPI000E524EC8|nr:DUF302 domain-containing protein [Ruegeria sp. AD91A]AXT27668.1 DUF302 domain-containing protein [Ruegeria sp. AD91A]